MNDFINLTDEELIERLRKGCLEVQEYLLEKYKPFVKSKSRVLFLVGGDKEDLIQEGMIGLFKAIRDFNPENGAPFAAFAKLCVERQLYTAIESAGRLKNAPLNAYISLSEESENLMDGGIEDVVIEKASYQQMYENMQEYLSAMEKEVLELYLEGKDYTEIAKLLGKTDKSIDNALQRIKGKIRKNYSQKE
ncbi:MAG: sigma-70 family RNA polymerase sigma factor [Lachnospiraceae bacterium]|nr:sigma-70 family RNA polymerase sigma factor [Lachnospiraceae bacterium]